MRAVEVQPRGRGSRPLSLCEECVVELGLNPGPPNGVQWTDRKTERRLRMLTDRERAGRFCGACGLRLREPYVRLPENLDVIIRELAGDAADEFTIELAMRRASIVAAERRPRPVPSPSEPPE